MSMRTKFEALVSDLNKETLEELRRSVASEIDGRRQKTAIKVEDIHPAMTAAEKERAAQEITRVLRGQE